MHTLIPFSTVEENSIFYKSGQSLYYYKKDDSTLEIEFLLERDAHAIPVEVKAKKGSSKSLNELLKSSQIPVGYKFTAQNASSTANEDKRGTIVLFLCYDKPAISL